MPRPASSVLRQKTFDIFLFVTLFHILSFFIFLSYSCRPIVHPRLRVHDTQQYNPWQYNPRVYFSYALLAAIRFELLKSTPPAGRQRLVPTGPLEHFLSAIIRSFFECKSTTESWARPHNPLSRCPQAPNNRPVSFILR